jgi:hypothetical protein
LGQFDFEFRTIPLVAVAILVAGGLSYVRGADAEERVLDGQEKAAVLTEIADRFRELPSIGLRFTFNQKTAKETLQSEHFVVLDDHRHYFRSTAIHTDAELRANPGLMKCFHVKSWDGSVLRTLNDPSGSMSGTLGSIASEIVIFEMFGRDSTGRSWQARYRNREREHTEYEVILDTEKDRIRVVEQPGEPGRVYSRQM